MGWRQGLREIEKDWGIPRGRLAAFLHVNEERLEAWLAGEGIPDEELPEGGGSVPPLLTVHRRLREGLPDAETQLKWLMTAHPLLEGLRPVDVLANSPEGVLWVAYLLDSGLLEKARQASKAPPSNSGG